MLGGVVVTAYNIEITQPAGTPCPSNQCSLDPSTHTTTITNLDYNIEYIFAITASSCGGASAKASLTTFVIGKGASLQKLLIFHGKISYFKTCTLMTHRLLIYLISVMITDCSVPHCN